MSWPDVLYNSSYIDNKGKLIVEEGQYQTDTLGAQAIAQIHTAKELQKPFCKTPIITRSSTSIRFALNHESISLSQTSTSRPSPRTRRRAWTRGRRGRSRGAR